MSDVSHGVNAGKTDSGAITPVSVDTGVHFVVGTAPVQATNGKVNEVIMASSYAEAVQALGYSDDWKKYSLCEEIYTAFTLFNSAQVFFVNVLDPTTGNIVTTDYAAVKPDRNCSQRRC